MSHDHSSCCGGHGHHHGHAHDSSSTDGHADLSGPPEAPILVEVTRGGMVESVHRGRACIVDSDGRVLAQWGDIESPVYPRSAVKAIQAIPLLETGAFDAYGLGDQELALACSSHNGELRHTRLAQAWTGAGLAGAAARALEKIEAVVPEARRRELADSRLFAPDFGIPPAMRERMDTLRAAINARRVIAFDYAREDGALSVRSVRPLGLFFWGRVWTLGAWCELRDDFRNFRLDRMERLHSLERGFDEVPGQSLDDLIARCRAE